MVSMTRGNSIMNPPAATADNAPTAVNPVIVWRMGSGILPNSCAAFDKPSAIEASMGNRSSPIVIATSFSEFLAICTLAAVVS